MKAISNMEEALSFIHGSKKLGSKLGLANIKELCMRVGEPQKKLQFIHVAGTNGKGTVTTAVAAVLKAAGYKTGAYTSPYVYQFNERIAIDGKPITDAEIARHTNSVYEACAAMVKDGFSHPTEFEIVTAVGFLCFAAAACEYVVLEVGLGGRLDATNVIENPICTVITQIGYDHMEYLGDSLADIAAEKCGIVKSGIPTVISAEEPMEALRVIKDCCEKKQVPLSIAKMPQKVQNKREGCYFSVGAYDNLFLPLAGTHMAKNACLAVQVIEVLRERGITISDRDLYEGLQSVVHRGRFETIHTAPLCIVDGAHNMDGITAFLDTVAEILPNKNLVLVFGMLADKEYKKALEAIGSIGNMLITITVPSPRAATADLLCKESNHPNTVAAESIEKAIEMAFSEKPDAVLAFGSLYMLADIYAAVKKCSEGKICE